MVKLRLSNCSPYSFDDDGVYPVAIQQVVRLRINSGSATSGPPIGPVLGQYAIPISKFCTEFNERTLDFFNSGVAVFVTLFYFVDGSYTFNIALPINSICFRMAVGIRNSTGMPLGSYNSKSRSSSRNWTSLGAISQYMLWEAIEYNNQVFDVFNLYTGHIYYSNCLGTLRSEGIILYSYRAVN